MKQSMVTSAIRFSAANADAVDALLDTLRPELFGRGAIRSALRGKGIHFLSITVVRGSEDEPTHLVVEISADGDPEDIYTAVALGLEEWLTRIFATAGIASPGPSEARPVRVRHARVLLMRTRVRTGHGLFQTAGLDFCGTPGMTVDRIRAEYELADWLRTLPAESRSGESALDAVLRIRGLADAHPAFALLRTPEPVDKLEVKSIAGLEAGSLLALGGRAVLVFLWPVLLVLGMAVITLAVLAWRTQGWTVALLTLGALVLVAGLILVAIVLWLYGRLRSAEDANTPIDTTISPAAMDAIAASENLKDTQQNHLAGISVMQAGWVRELTLRLAFLVIAQMAAKHFRPGFLGDIGTIHYARWLRLPGTNKLLFFSNYGGSWESYLEDFITKASGGLTGAWSNTMGFPRTENLFFKGSMDGDRFKRWARRQQQPSRFWYSAYPHLTTARIRTNAAIRQGLWTVDTEEGARAWLGLFGSTVRPRDLIETAEVQTLLYGGLSRHRFAVCLALVLPEEPASARRWLRTILPRITFGDEPPAEAVLVLSLAASGLRRLRLPEDVHNQFPAAFRAGMSSPGRANVLGDTGDDHASRWRWGGPGTPVDAVLLLYADTEDRLTQDSEDLTGLIKGAGGRLVHQVRPVPLPERMPAQSGARVAYEPFGFADGVSQPIVRGTRRWLRQSDAIHTVEPGEFLLGYPDGRGYFPPSPTVPAALDPQKFLPAAGKAQAEDLLLPSFDVKAAPAHDFGRNGSFMVVRQLAQDVTAFRTFVADAARKHADHPAVPRQLPESLREDWIGAKMVGRWKDGSSLVRFPHGPATSRGHPKDRFQPDNEFLFGGEDPLGERCPLGSHIRRSNPRDSMRPGSTEELAIVNRHRILRLGRSFDPAGANDPEEPDKPGLLFVCLNADIERQFEFIQQTWSMAWQFHGLANEVDPITGRGKTMGRLTIPSPNGPLNLTGIKDFVRMRGGAYLFMPSRSALRFLADLRVTAA